MIGAGRSGTTSLHHYLRQHPEVYVCDEKSPNFFAAAEPQPPWETGSLRAMALHWVSDLATYEALFDNAGGRKAVGEVSPVYLQARGVPGRIHSLCPDVRLVAILREPVARAYAHFLGRRRDGLERRRDFSAVVDEELSRPLPDDVAFGSYLGCGRYHHFLRGYFDRFPRERIRIYLFEDLHRDAPALLADLFGFLGVDPTFVPDTTARHARTGLIANPIARFAWTGTVGLRTRLRPWLPRSLRDVASPLLGSALVQPPLDPRLRARLQAVFHDDVVALARLIERDLSHWLAPEGPGEPARGAGAGEVPGANGSSAGSRGRDPRAPSPPSRTRD